MNQQHIQIRPRDILKMVIFAGGALILLIGAVWGLSKWQSAPPPAESAAEAAPATLALAAEPEDDALVLKDELSTYLFMGIDRDGPAKSNHSYIDGGQADVQFLLVVDDAAKTWQMLHINRDSVVDVPILGITGRPIRTERQQIALAHAYGDGGTDSCRNAQTAVSNMLGGQPIDGYLALNMGGIAILNDFVGGITVTIESDFSEVDPSLVMGQTITLNGEQAYNFIRHRRNVDDQTNLSRMERHRQYLTGLSEKLAEMSQQDILRGYDAVFDYMVTDIGSKTLTKLVGKLQTYTQLDTLTVDGESYLDEQGCNAIALNQESLEQAIRQLFYQKK